MHSASSRLPPLVPLYRIQEARILLHSTQRLEIVAADAREIYRDTGSLDRGDDVLRDDGHRGRRRETLFHRKWIKHLTSERMKKENLRNASWQADPILGSG